LSKTLAKIDRNIMRTKHSGKKHTCRYSEDMDWIPSPVQNMAPVQSQETQVVNCRVAELCSDLEELSLLDQDMSDWEGEETEEPILCENSSSLSL
jgi:hypothetical protein